MLFLIEEEFINNLRPSLAGNFPVNYTQHIKTKNFKRKKYGAVGKNILSIANKFYA